MKNESIIKNSTKHILKISILKIDVVYFESDKYLQTPHEISSNAVIEYDSRLITAARERKLKIENTNKPETRYFGYHIADSVL